MRLLTAQAIADEGELEVLGYRLPEESSRPGPVRRHAAARQPRRDADGGAEPARLHAPLPDRTSRPRCRDRARARDGESRRPARQPRRQALRRNAAAAADRPCACPPAPPGPARRAHGRARPPGPPGAVGAHRLAAGRRHHDSHVDALHRGGATSGRHGADHVPWPGGCGRASGRARRRARRPGGGRGVRPAEARGGRARRPCRRVQTRRTGTSVSVLGVDAADGRAPEGERRAANLEDVFVLLTGEEIE